MSEHLPSRGEFLLYQADDGRLRLDVRLQDETIWLTQKQLAALFQTSVPNINMHIKNVFAEGELAPDSVVQDFLITAEDGKDYQAKHYNLDLIISVGYRVKSLVATRFRIWATQRLREYIVKGFVLDDERLKNPPGAGPPVPDYFDELLARIRDIRASERRMYLRVREIFAMAADYDPTDRETLTFFKIIQNKLHFAATGKTAAELIRGRADASKPNMGLTTWQKDVVRKTDVTVAKNYLRQDEIEALNRIVVMWLDFAEDQARRRKQIFMQDWQQKLDEFLAFNDRRVLHHAGTVSKADAESHAKEQYDRFSEQRREQKEQLGEIESIRMLEEAAKEFEEKEGRADG